MNFRHSRIEIVQKSKDSDREFCIKFAHTYEITRIETRPNHITPKALSEDQIEDQIQIIEDLKTKIEEVFINDRSEDMRQNEKKEYQQ